VLATLFAVKESRDESVGKEIDYLGLGTLTAGLTALVLALIESNSWGWGSPAIVGLLVGSVVMLAAFVVIERGVRVPMVELPLFKTRNFVGTNLVALVVTFAMMAQFFFVTLYMQNILGFSPVEAGLRFLPATLMIVAFAPIAGRLTDRVGPRWLIGGGLTIVSISLYWLTTIQVGTTYGDIWPSFTLMGLGMALVMSPMSTAAMNAVSVAKAGVASGILSMNRMIGGTLGIAVIGAVFAAMAPDGVSDPGAFVDAFTSSMWVATGVTVLGAVIAIALLRGKAEREPQVGQAEAATTAQGTLATGELEQVPA
jgi:MFS family permease